VLEKSPERDREPRIQREQLQDPILAQRQLDRRGSITHHPRFGVERQIADRQAVDWVAVLSFLSAVFIINHLLERARADAANAKRREYVAQMIARITQAIGWSDGLESLLEAIVTWAARNLPICGCSILLEAPNGELVVRNQAGIIPPSDNDRLAEA
jgi:hypothetical protein